MMASLVMGILVITASLSVLFFAAAVKDEDYKAQAPGSLFLKATGLWNVIIITACFCIMHFRVIYWNWTYRFAIVGFNLYVAIIITYTYFHIFIGILAIKYNMKPSFAKVLRNLSIISMIVSIILFVYFTNHFAHGYLGDLVHIVPIISFVNSVLFCVGANKNNLHSPHSL